MQRTIMILFIALAALLGGCATQQDRVERIRAQYPQMDQASVQELAEGRIRVGMTQDMVRYAKGKPTFIRKENGKVVWEYVEYVTDGWGAYVPKKSYTVYFQNGKVVDIQGDS